MGADRPVDASRSCRDRARPLIETNKLIQVGKWSGHAACQFERRKRLRIYSSGDSIAHEKKTVSRLCRYYVRRKDQTVFPADELSLLRLKHNRSQLAAAGRD